MKENRVSLILALLLIPAYQTFLIIIFKSGWTYISQLVIFTSLYFFLCYSIFQEKPYSLLLTKIILIVSVCSDLFLAATHLVDLRYIAVEAVYTTALLIFVYRIESDAKETAKGYQIWPILAIIYSLFQPLISAAFAIIAIKNIIRNRALKGLVLSIIALFISLLMSLLFLGSMIFLAVWTPPQIAQTCMNLCDEDDHDVNLDLLSEDYICNCMNGTRINIDLKTHAEAPYLTAIRFNDPEIKKLATNLTRGCDHGDKECQTFVIYRWVVENIEYTGDARDNEHIQSPYDTLNIGSGDCEDLTILLNSLLENIRIQTYMVVAEEVSERNHVYALACDLNPDILKNYTINYFSDWIEADENEGSFELKGRAVKYLPLKENSENRSRHINFTINSTKNIDIYLVRDKSGYDNFIEDKEYIYYPNCSYMDYMGLSKDCYVSVEGGFILYNKGVRPVTVDYDIKVMDYIELNESLLNISTYQLDSECIVLEPAGGEYGYPGMEGEYEGNMIAIDPIRFTEFPLTR